MRDCCSCKYQSVRVYKEPCLNCVDLGAEGGSCFEPKRKEESIMPKQLDKYCKVCVNFNPVDNSCPNLPHCEQTQTHPHGTGWKINKEIAQHPCCICSQGGQEDCKLIEGVKVDPSFKICNADTNYFKFTPKESLVGSVTPVHANPDYGVGNTHVVDDGTAAASPHYNSLGVQPIEVMEDIMTYEEFKGFLKGNMIKYAMRAGKKDRMEKDVTKYNQYRDWYDMCCGGLRVSATLKK